MTAHVIMFNVSCKILKVQTNISTIIKNDVLTSPPYLPHKSRKFICVGNDH